MPDIRVRRPRGHPLDEEVGAGELVAANGVAGVGVLVRHDGDVPLARGVLHEVAVLVAAVGREAVLAPVVRAAEHVADLVGGDDPLAVLGHPPQRDSVLEAVDVRDAAGAADRAGHDEERHVGRVAHGRVRCCRFMKVQSGPTEFHSGN